MWALPSLHVVDSHMPIVSNADDMPIRPRCKFLNLRRQTELAARRCPYKGSAAWQVRLAAIPQSGVL